MILHILLRIAEIFALTTICFIVWVMILGARADSTATDRPWDESDRRL